MVDTAAVIVFVAVVLIVAAVPVAAAVPAAAVAEILLVFAAVLIRLTVRLLPQVAACCCRMIHKILNLLVHSYHNLDKTYVKSSFYAIPAGVAKYILMARAFSVACSQALRRYHPMSVPAAPSGP